MTYCLTQFSCEPILGKLYTLIHFVKGTSTINPLLSKLNYYPYSPS